MMEAIKSEKNLYFTFAICTLIICIMIKIYIIKLGQFV